MNETTLETIKNALYEVFDPEIPSISVMDLGIISEVKQIGDMVQIYMTPTFSGCPALKLIAEDIKAKAIEKSGYENIEVIIDKTSGWDTNKITDKGRQILKEFGLAPPLVYEGELEVSSIAQSHCPYCGGSVTALTSTFGSTLCRSIHYCYKCNQTYEQFKPL